MEKEGLRFFEKRKIAWAVLAVCVVGSVLGLGGASLKKDAAKLEEIFYHGSDTTQTTRYSMDAYLDRAAECASIMANEVLLRLDGENATAEEILSLTEILSDSTDTNRRYRAYEIVKSDSDVLYNAMYASSLSDAERRDFKTAYDDFWGADKFIRRDDYRELAASFNDELTDFPAGAVGALWGVGPYNTFGA